MFFGEAGGNRLSAARSLSLALFLGLAAMLLCSRSVFAADYLLEQAPPPTSAHDLGSPLEEQFEKKPERLLPPVVAPEEIRELPPFLRDSSFRLKPRTYYFDRTRKDDSKAKAWALGGSLDYESGKIYDVFHMGTEVFTSQKLYGPLDKDGTNLLRPGQDSYTVLGTLYGKFDYADQQISLFRQRVDSPYINKQDSRMTPNTFELYMLHGSLFASPKLEYALGYISRMKEQTSTSFRYMSDVAGAEGTKKGTTAGGMRISPTEDFWIGAINYHTPDVHNFVYSEAEYKVHLANDIDLKLSLQYSDQHSVGDELIGALSTHLWGTFVSASYRNVVLGFAYVRVSKNDDMLNPYGSFPGFNSVMIKDYKKAGEQSYRIFLSYNFEPLGLPFLSTYTNVVIGDGRVDPDTGSPLPDDTEFDFTIDLRQDKGLFENFWLRLRTAHVWDDDDAHREDYRIILNVDIPVLSRRRAS